MARRATLVGAALFALTLGLAALVAVPGARRDDAPAPRPMALASGAGPARAAAPNAAAASAPAAVSPMRAIPRFDVHTHLGPEVADAARTFLASRGIARAVNLSGGTAGEGLEESLAASRRLGGFFVVFANVQFRGFGEPGWAAREVAQLERAKRLGARGVKIHKVLGLRLRWPDGRRVAVDDPALDPLFDAAGRLGLPVAIHTGDPKAFFDPPGPGNERWDELQVHPGWSFADRSLYPTWPQIVDEFERRVARSSRTTFIGVHFGNAPEEPARVGRMLAAHANLWVDTAARIPELGRKPAEVRQVILDHQDRVLFGTDLQLGPDHLVLGAGEPGIPPRAMIDRFFDATWRFFETPDRQFDHPTPIQGRWRIDGLGLPEAVVEKVYRRNAERLLGEAAAAP